MDPRKIDELRRWLQAPECKTFINQFLAHIAIRQVALAELESHPEMGESETVKEQLRITRDEIQELRRALAIVERIGGFQSEGPDWEFLRVKIEVKTI